MKRAGRLASGEQTLPFATCYSWDTATYSYDPEEIWRVQEAFRLIDEDGLTNLSECARRVGLKRTAMRPILSNWIFADGSRVYDKQRDMAVKRIGPNGKTYRPKIAVPPDQIIKVKVIAEPAVPIERFLRVQKILEELRLNHVATLPKEKRVHLCTTYGRCGCCGQVLYLCGNGKKDKQTGRPLLWYCCCSQHPGKKGNLPRCENSWVSSKKLNTLLIAFATFILTDEKLLCRLIAGSLKLSSEVIRPFPKTGMQDMIAKLEKQERKLIRMCSSDAISIAELKRERLKIREEIDRLRSVDVASPVADQPMTLETFVRLVIKGAIGFRRLHDAREQKALLEQIFAEVFFRHESVTGFRFHPSFVASMGDQAKELGQIISLNKPFRITPEIPVGHKQCSKCLVILPQNSFPIGRLFCPDCYRVYNTERHRRYRQRRALNRGRQASA